MTVQLWGFHPTFDALSALADKSDIDSAQGRVGRHAARCAECRRTVADIRALGDLARRDQLPGVPDELWPAIERAVANANVNSLPASAVRRETPSRGAGVLSSVARLRPISTVTEPSRTQRRGILIALAAAAFAGVMILVPSRRANRLQAAPRAGQWRFTPQRPSPGVRVVVRFEPSPTMRGDSVLLLLGGSPRGWRDPMASPSELAGLDDSLGVLVRQRDGAYEGAFMFPSGSSALVLKLRDIALSSVTRSGPASDPMGREPDGVTLLVTGDAKGRPSLAALTSALDLWRGSERPAYRVADTLIHYFPDEPVGYAGDRTVGGRGLISDLVHYFKRGEGQYLRFDRRYADRTDVSADHEVEMIRFANRLDEPGELRKWTMRLAREHPDDPRALFLYAGMLADMLNRPNTIDSVRRDLPFAEGLWERGGRPRATVELASVSARVGDVEGNLQWIRRGVETGAFGYAGFPRTVDEPALDDASIRAALSEPLRARLAEPCVLPAGKYPRSLRFDLWVPLCREYRAWSFAALSRIERSAGHPPAALALADSSLATYRLNDGWCSGQIAHRRRGEALLALYDTVAAAGDLAIAVTRWQGSGDRVRDSLGAILTPAVAPARWNGLVAAAADSLTACVADVGRRERERRAAETRRRGG